MGWVGGLGWYSFFLPFIFFSVFLEDGRRKAKGIILIERSPDRCTRSRPFDTCSDYNYSH